MKGEMPVPGAGPHIVRCRDLADVAARAAAAFAIDLQVAASTGRNLSWVAAGGPEAEGAFDVLASRHLQLPWHLATVLMGDERCVERDDPRSNWRQLESRFLHRLPAEAPRRIAPHGDLGPERAADDYAGRIAAECGDAPAFDHVWLGVGANGHTLSLFPGRPMEGPLVVPVVEAPDPPPERISFTLAALGRVRHCVVLAAGADKREAVTRTLGGDFTLPIGQVTDAIARGGGEVTWIVDLEAAPLSAHGAPDGPARR